MKYLNLISLLCLLGACNSQPSKPRLPYYKGPQMEPKWILPGDDLSGFTHVQWLAFDAGENDNLLWSKSSPKVGIAHFFKLPCKGSCPELSRTMVALQDKYASDSLVQLISLVYPEDTANQSALSGYIKRYKPEYTKWIVTSSSQQDASGFISSPPQLSVEGKITIPSSEHFYLLDGNGYVRGMYKATDPIELENLYLDVGIQKKAAHKVSP